MKRHPFILVAAAGLLLGTAPGPALAAGGDSEWEPIDLEEAVALAQEFLPADLELPDLERLEQFWAPLAAVLQADTLESLADARDAVLRTCAALEADPAMRPWADWLRQKLDYFEMARDTLQDLPSAPAPAPAVPSSVPTGAPPAALRPADVPPDTQTWRLVVSKPPTIHPADKPGRASQPLDRVRNAARWKAKLAGRPPPAAAVSLAPRLKTAFEREGVPPELIWIAEAESSFNPSARSPSGALGLFQLMPATARRFGLRTGFFDERKHPEKSAQAAARYLAILHRQMGSWPLALAAYNAGEGRVGRLLKGAEGSTFDAIAGRLPLETQMYVPKVTALVALRERRALDSLPPPHRAGG